MPVEMSDEEFTTVLDALVRATSQYDVDDIASVLIELRKAKRVCLDVDARRS